MATISQQARGQSLYSSVPNNQPVFIDFDSDFDVIYESFSPLFAASKNLKEATFSTAIVSKVLNDSPVFSIEQKVGVGIALIRGSGIPKNIQLGWDILKNLEPDDIRPHAAEVSKALRPLDPILAYKLALIAGSESQPGSMGLLSQLENQLGIPKALDLQDHLRTRLSVKKLPTSRLKIRQKARKLFQGLGQQRSYYNSLYFANICGAQGDIECQEIADRIMNKLLKDRDWATETRIREVEAAAFADWMKQ